MAKAVRKPFGDFMQAVERALARRGLTDEQVKWAVKQKAVRQVAKMGWTLPNEIRQELRFNTRTIAAKIADTLMLAFAAEEMHTQSRGKAKARRKGSLRRRADL
jgi:hypothetical protein